MGKSLFLLGFFAIFIISGILIAGCTSETPLYQTNDSTTGILTISHITPTSLSVQHKSTYGEAKDVFDANNQFAFELYKNLINDPRNDEANLFFSPYSMSSVFAITYEGARGTTADEIASVFHFPRDDSSRRQQFSKINEGINRNDPSYHMSTANALWAEKTYPFRTEYLNTVQQYYHANATNIDFNNSPENSRVLINKWVDNKTEGRITDLLPKNSVNKFTRLIITNTIYFNGTWVSQFDPYETRYENFTVAPEKNVRTNMMVKDYSRIDFRYYENDLLQAVEMPYTNKTGREISMLVILPKGNNLTAVENSLDGKNFTTLRNALESQIVHITLPKYRIENQYLMKPVLENMGMPTAFSEAADFSGMDGTQNLYITSIIHKTFIDVNEKGTEAAGATAVEYEPMCASLSQPKIYTFIADHPFIFIIEDEENGSIFFMGRVMNPNA